MSDSAAAWIRLAIFIVVVAVAAPLAGFLTFQYVARIGSPASADSQSLAQVQQQLTNIDKRIDDLESRRKSELPKSSLDATAPDATAANQAALRAARPQYQISPASAAPPRPVAAQPAPDPASAQKIASLQQGMGTLQAETDSNREAWQATADRLADVAGELGTQHGQILQNQDQLNQFLGRAAHTSITFELRRGSVPESVGPVRISLKGANEKSQRYTLCVYHQNTCLEMKDRVLYEVVQLAVSHDSAPIELIATQVEKDGIVGYVEVPTLTPAN